MDDDTAEFIRSILSVYFTDFPANIIIAALDNTMDADTEYALIPSIHVLHKFAGDMFDKQPVGNPCWMRYAAMIDAISNFLCRVQQHASMQNRPAVEYTTSYAHAHIPALDLGLANHPRSVKRSRSFSTVDTNIKRAKLL